MGVLTIAFEAKQGAEPCNYFVKVTCAGWTDSFGRAQSSHCVPAIMGDACTEFTCVSGGFGSFQQRVILRVERHCEGTVNNVSIDLSSKICIST